MIHKRTALPQTEGLFIGAFERLHPEYRNIQLELVRIDTFSSSVPRDPHRYRLVATTNLFGDILSDQTSGLAGGVAVAPSLIAGSEHAMAQGARDRARYREKGNRQLLGVDPVDVAIAELVLPEDQDRGLSRDRAAARSLRNAIPSGVATPDLGGDASTDAFATAVSQPSKRHKGAWRYQGALCGRVHRPNRSRIMLRPSATASSSVSAMRAAAASVGRFGRRCCAR